MNQYARYLKENIYKLSLRNVIHYVLAVLQFVGIVCGVLSMIQAKNSMNRYEIPLSSFALQAGTTLEDGTLYIDESAGGAHFVHGPYVSVDKGTYRLTVNYEATGDAGYLFIYDENALYDDIQADEYYLTAETNVFSTEFSISADLENLECRIIYLGEGSLKISAVTLEETPAGVTKNFVGIIVSVFAIQLLYYLYFCCQREGSMLAKRKYELFGLVFIWVLTSYPLFTDYLYWGHDISFHLKRIEGIKEGLLSGQFPVRIQPGWWSGAGYATGVYYPDVFLYFPAILRILGFSVQEAFRIFLITINAVTCILTYKCFYRISNNSKAALLGTLLYAASAYRLTVLYIRQAVGEFTAMTFLPLVLYGFLKILNMDEKKPKSNAPVWLPLVIGMTGVLSSHIITSEVTVMFMAILSIFFVKNIFQRKRWLEFLKAIGMTLLINMWYLVPFLDYFLKKQHNISMTSLGADIQKSGTFLGQLFMTFPNFDANSANEYAKEGIGMEMPINIGIPIILFAGIVLCFRLDENRKRDKRVIVATKLIAIGLMALVFSLHVFPWNAIGTHTGVINKLFFTIQFLWRYLGYALVFLCTGGVIAFAILWKTERKEKVYSVSILITALSIAMVAHFCDTEIASHGAFRVYTTEGVEHTADTFYLPNGSDVNKYMNTTRPFSSDGVLIENVDRNGMSMNLQVVNQRGVEEVITIPFVYYEGYRAKSINDNQYLEIVETTDKMVGILIHENYSGEIKVSFVGKWYWRVAELISVCTVIFMIIFLSCRRKTNKA